MTLPMPALRTVGAQRPVWTASDIDDGLELTSIEVPLDYSEPDGERINIAIGRLRASDPARRRGVLLAIHGGPGGNNGLGRRVAAELARCTPLNQVYDLIGIDCRGYGDSVPRLVGESTPAKAPFDSRPPDSVFPLLAEDMRAREEDCRRAGGRLRPFVSTCNIARDMDMIRQILGEETISFIGYAYGTLVGPIYGAMFPGRLDRSVLDSAVHPEWLWREQFMSQARAIRESVDQWTEWTGRRNNRYGLGRDAPQVLAAVEETAALLHKASGSPALHTAFDGLVGTLAPERPEWDKLGRLIGELRQAARTGDTSRAESLMSGASEWRPEFSEGHVQEAVLEAVTCETDWPADLEVYYQDMRLYREKYPYGYGALRSQPWVGTFRSFVPPDKRPDIRRGACPPGLVVQADCDPLDHHEGARAMAEQLGFQLILEVDSGGHFLYAFGGNSEVDEHVNRYMLEGVLPVAPVACTGKPRPDIAEDAA